VKLALLAIELAILIVLVVYYHYSRDLEGLEAGIGTHRPAETTQIYARDGRTLLYELVDPQGGRRTVVDGPFAESKELVGGFYVIEVASLEEAIEWAVRCPTGLGFDDVLEIRQLTGEDDLTPQLLDLVKRAAPTWSAAFVRGGKPA